MTKEFLKLMQARVSTVAVGASTARRLGPEGTIRAARAFLAMEIDLARLAKLSAKDFAAELDTLTEELQKSLPRGGRHWGAARKYLNIFLRDAVYNFDLRVAYKLERLLPMLEVPLDAQVAKGLGCSGKKWRGVKNLTPSQSAELQKIASKKKAEELPPDYSERVHLDLIYWRSEERNAQKAKKKKKKKEAKQARSR